MGSRIYQRELLKPKAAVGERSDTGLKERLATGQIAAIKAVSRRLVIEGFFTKRICLAIV
jgi:hypothetical protein